MRGLACFALVSVLAVPSLGQAGSASSDVPSAARARAEIFGGFSLAAGGAQQAGRVTGTDYGFNGGADFRLFPHIFLVADVSQYSDPTDGIDKSSDTAFLFGPRFLVPFSHNSRVSVFGEILAGGDLFHNSGQSYTFTYNNATAFAQAVQGGLDFAWNRRVSTRF